jgi:hypothetical protein
LEHADAVGILFAPGQIDADDSHEFLHGAGLDFRKYGKGS